MDFHGSSCRLAYPRSKKKANPIQLRSITVKWNVHKGVLAFASLVQLVRHLVRNRHSAQNVLSQGHAGSSAIGLNVDRGNLSVLDNDGIPLGTVAAKDGLVVEAQIESFGELSRRVCEEAELHNVSIAGMQRHQCCNLRQPGSPGPSGHPKPSCCSTVS